MSNREKPHSQVNTFPITHFFSDSRSLTKTYTRGPDGALQKAYPPKFSGGMAFRHEITLAKLAKGLDPDQCIARGVMKGGLTQAKVATIGALRANPDPDTIARSKDYLEEAEGPGLLFLDGDPDKKAIPPIPALTREEIVKRIEEVSAVEFALLWAAYASRPSSSAGQIIDDAGNVLHEGGGSHVFIGVVDARDVPRALSVIVKRLVIAGYGSVKVTKSGGICIRTLIDRSVDGAERLIFCSAAKLGPGLSWRNRAEPFVQDGVLLDTREAFPDLSDEEKAAFEAECERLRSQPEVLAEVARVKPEWAAGHAARSTERRRKRREERAASTGEESADADEPIDPAVFEAMLDPIGKNSKGEPIYRISGDFELHLDSGDVVTVLQLIRNAAFYDGETMADPFDPEDGEGKAQFFSNIGGRGPRIHSFAHGGADYILDIGAEARFEEYKASGQIPNGDYGSSTAGAGDKAERNDGGLRNAFKPKAGGKMASMARAAWDTDRDARHIALVPSRSDRRVGLLAAALFCLANIGAFFRRAENIVTPRTTVTTNPLPGGADVGGFDAASLGGEERIELRTLDTRAVQVLLRESVCVWKWVTPEKFSKMEDTAHLQDYEWMCANAANFAEIDGALKACMWERAKMPVDAATTAETEISEGNDDARLEPLRICMSSPTISKSGEVLARDGYYASAQTIVALGDLTGHISIPADELLSIDGPVVREAVGVVRRYIAAFPYANAFGEAVLTSWLYSNVAKPAFGLAPVHIIEAPVFGAGKTYAVTVIVITAGSVPHVIPCGTSSDTRDADDEVGKRINSLAISGGAGGVVLDDVPRGRMPNPQDFRTLVTADKGAVRLRPFGKLGQDVVVDPFSFVWCASGNNVRVEDDMVRRCIKGRLDRHEAEKRQEPWSQEKAAAYVTKVLRSPVERGTLLSAVLTILRANVLHRPHRMKPYDNYGEWSVVTREAVILTTGVDPVETSEQLKRDDPKAQQLATVAEALHALSGGEAFKMADVASRAWDLTRPDFLLSEEEKAAKKAAPAEKRSAAQVIVDTFRGKELRDVSGRLGYFVRDTHGRWTNGQPRYRICRLERDRNDVASWCVEKE